MREVDVTISHRRDAIVWVPYFDRTTPAKLTHPSVAKTGSAPAACFPSSSFNWSRRIEYLIALMAHLPVDSYGRVFRNRQLTPQDRGTATKLATIAATSSPSPSRTPSSPTTSPRSCSSP
jgi:hypothetical protein